MKKEQLQIELNTLLAEASKLERQAIVENETITFLGDEADKILIKSQDESLSLEERELICKQMATLLRRIQIENDFLAKDMKQLSDLSEKLNYYSTLIIEE